MTISSEEMGLSKWEARLFEQREKIDVVKKGLYRAVAGSVVSILFMIFMSRTMSKGMLVAVFAVCIALACVRRICYGLVAIGYKRIICKLMKRLDEKKSRG